MKKLSKEVILYLIFGISTTIINIVMFQMLIQLNISIIISNTIAWFISVLFAYMTNKRYVFESKNESKSEIVLFFSSRLFSLIVDNIGILILINVILVNEFYSKIIINIIVIIINYLFSKFLVFKQKK